MANGQSGVFLGGAGLVWRRQRVLWWVFVVHLVLESFVAHVNAETNDNGEWAIRSFLRWRWIGLAAPACALVGVCCQSCPGELRGAHDHQPRRAGAESQPGFQSPAGLWISCVGNQRTWESAYRVSYSGLDSHVLLRNFRSE